MRLIVRETELRRRRFDPGDSQSLRKRRRHLVTLWRQTFQTLLRFRETISVAGGAVVGVPNLYAGDHKMMR